MDIIALTEIEKAYQPGYTRHWFDRDTMRFFGTRLAQYGYLTASGDAAYFVTSEQPPHGSRAYSVRKFTFADREIETVGEFCGYRTRGTAQRVAQRLAAKGE